MNKSPRLTLFLIVIEGGTVPLGFPFAVIIPLVVLIWGRYKLNSEPLTAFFFISCLLALLLMAGWCIYWGGCLEFSDLGII